MRDQWCLLHHISKTGMAEDDSSEDEECGVGSGGKSLTEKEYVKLECKVWKQWMLEAEKCSGVVYQDKRCGLSADKSSNQNASGE